MKRSEIYRQIIMTSKNGPRDVNNFKARLVVIPWSSEKRAADERSYNLTADPKQDGQPPTFTLTAQYDFSIEGIYKFGAFITAFIEGNCHRCIRATPKRPR